MCKNVYHRGFIRSPCANNEIFHGSVDIPHGKGPDSKRAPPFAALRINGSA